MSNPKFKVGDLIRYDVGATAMMRITSVLPNHAGYGKHYYCGRQFFGGAKCAYEGSCSLVVGDDLKKWIKDSAEFNE